MKTCRTGRSRGLAASRWCAGALATVVALSLALVATVARARESGAPDPTVARVAYVDGEVSYMNADADRWTPVDVNAPLVTGDRFYAGQDGKAEIQLAGGIYARLANDTELDVLELSTEALQVQVGVGTALFRVRRMPGDRYFEISTPATAVMPHQNGLYRIDVAEDGHTTVVVRDGDADAYQGDTRYRLAKARGAEFDPALEDGTYSTEPIQVFDASAVQPDTWDEWDSSRDARIASSASYRYVSPEIYGAEDLDQYGDWNQTPDYGPVWRPRQVAAGWAPFTDGRWVWQDPWGWTWVDYQPWGWAPSHYGRWVYVDDAWGWAPGPVVAAPVYTPAVVGFLGVNVSTPGFSLSVGVGPSVGWVPLGWGEPCLPWWGGFGGAVVGRPYWGGWGGPRIVNNSVVRNTNITNINVNNINYANIGRPGAFTAVSRDDFVAGNIRRIDIPRDRLRDVVRPIAGNPGIIPRSESLIAARPEQIRRGNAVAPPRQVLQRAAVTTRQPRMERPKFDDKIRTIEANRGAPVPPAQLRRLASAEGRKPVQMVQARGQRTVVPQVTAAAPERLRGNRGRAPVERARAERPEAQAGGGTQEAQQGRGQPPPGDAGARAGLASPDRGAERRGPNAHGAEQPGQPGTPDRPQGRAALERGAPGGALDAARQRESVRELREQVQRDRQGGGAGVAAAPDQQRGEREQRAAAMRAQQEEAVRRREQALGRQPGVTTQGGAAANQARTQGDRRALQAQQREQAASERQNRQEAQRAERDSALRAQQEEAARRREQAIGAREPAERQQRESATRQQQESQRQQRDAATRQQQESQRQQRDAVTRQQQESQRQQREAATRQQQESQRQQREAVTRQQQESQRQQREAVTRQQQESQRQQREAATRQQ
ncbi:MAG TPA: DUF6600 domain-containing protein, partial [Candidatus Binatia bacterium]|nr:DUF6600 domain-containing protein [Candidatus Binatia bacterium]